MVLPPEEQVPELLCTLTEQYGSLGAFIYLHPTHWQDSESDAGLAEKAALKQVFLLLRHLKQPLQQAAQQERGALLMVTRLDGSLGISLNNDFSPLAGGVFGLLKTLYQEWESVFCRAIDMAPSLNTKQSVRCILAELYDPSPLPVEVGYSSEGRTTLVAEAAPLVELPAEPTNSIRSTSVFLVSGGARGITAHCVFRLAQHYRCRFILLGRSQLHEEPAWAQGLDEAALKQRLLTEMSTQGKKLTPRMLNEAYKS
jgi:hypothetical protein